METLFIAAGIAVGLAVLAYAFAPYLAFWFFFNRPK